MIKDIEKVYVYGERLSEAKDKSQNVEDYKSIIQAARSSSVKARQLAAQLIPRFFKFFPALSGSAIVAHLDLCEAEELGIRVQAIRGLPLFCKNTPEHISKIVDILAQLLVAEENVERDAVHKALLSLLRQDVKVCNYNNVSDWILLQSLQDVTGAEFKMFMDFLKSLSIFGEKAPTKRVQVLIEIIEGQADLDAQFIISDGDHVDRLISCLYMALPFFIRGASSSKFLNYLNKHIIPVFDKLPEERKVDLLKNLAESSPYAAPQDSRQILPSVVQLLKRLANHQTDSVRTSLSFTQISEKGLENGALRACCGGGGPYNFNYTARCGQIGSKACKDPWTYANWDGVHLTETAYRHISTGLLKGTFTSPI
ncbi:hypothetical protein R6Q57_005541 [Mikania cordata]